MSRNVLESDLSEEMKISVIIPVYNVSAYIERCIHSVMNQTFCDFECILVDDASPDDSIAIAERMIADYDGSIRFRILHHDHNRGLSAARNTGTDAATGDYILYIDSDDTITNDCIEMLMTPVMRDNTIEIVMGNYVRVYDENLLSETSPTILDVKDLNSSEEIRKCFFDKKEINMGAWNKFIRKDFLNQHGISFKEGLLWEDWPWMFMVVKHLHHLYTIKETTYQYYRRPNSISTGTDVKTKQYHWGVIYYEISSHLTPGDSNREAKYYIRNFCLLYLDCAELDIYNKAAGNFRKALTIMHDSYDCMLLFLTGIMGKSRIGRRVFGGMRKSYRIVKKRQEPRNK